jgi:hypothetical protein
MTDTDDWDWAPRNSRWCDRRIEYGATCGGYSTARGRWARCNWCGHLWPLRRGTDAPPDQWWH